LHIFIPSDFDLWHFDLKLAPLVYLIQRYISTKLEVSTATLFRENCRHVTDGCNWSRTEGRTDGHFRVSKCLMRPSREGRIVNNMYTCSPLGYGLQIITKN